VRIVAELLGALDYAHTRDDDDGGNLGIVHRDVSPANVVVGYEGHVVLVDFGIARAAAWEDLTYTGEIRGKLEYAAPEQARGEPIDRRADVYAAGVLLGRLVGERGAADVAAIVRRATAPERADRFATAGAMRDELLALARTRGLEMSVAPLRELVRATFGERPHPSTAPDSWFAALQPAARARVASPSPPPRRKRRARWWLLAAATTCVLFVVGLGLSLSHEDDADDVDTHTATPTALQAPLAPAEAAAVQPSIPVPTTPAPSVATSPANEASTPARARAGKAARPRARKSAPRSAARDPDALLPTREVR
jgi:serine/threonine-protein kinase